MLQEQMEQNCNVEPHGRDDAAAEENPKGDDVMSLSSIAERMYAYY